MASVSGAKGTVMEKLLRRKFACSLRLCASHGQVAALLQMPQKMRKEGLCDTVDDILAGS